MDESKIPDVPLTLRPSGRNRGKGKGREYPAPDYLVFLYGSFILPAGMDPFHERTSPLL